MKAPMILLSALCLLLVSFTTPSGDCSKKCPGKAACSNEFRSLTVSLSVKNDMITNYRTVRVEDGFVVNFNPAPLLAENTYLLLTDAEKNLTDKKGKEFYFVGYWYDREILREKFTVATIDNHVVITKGNPQIYVKPGC